MMGTVMWKYVTLAALMGILIASLVLFFYTCKKRELGQMSARELISLLDHKDPAVRGPAAYELRRFGGDRDREIIITKLIATFADEDDLVRRYAVSAIAQLGDSDTSKALYEALTHEDELIRRYAHLALSSYNLCYQKRLLSSTREAGMHASSSQSHDPSLLPDPMEMEPFPPPPDSITNNPRLR